MTLSCQPLPTDREGIFRCPVCGLENPRPIKRPFIAQCGKQAEMEQAQKEAAQRLADETGDLTILDKIGHYSGALWRWSLSGWKTRSKEEIERIYADHCLLCDDRDTVVDACKLCGCNVRTEGMAIRKKLAMKSESCPKGKWGADPGQTVVIQDRELILVLGLHGSLSSCLALCLKQMGVWMGQERAGGEDRSAGEMCERLMPYPRSEFAVDDAVIDWQLSRWLAGFQAAAPAEGPIGVKYPTLCALADRLAKLPVPLKVVVMDRPLMESIQSGRHRNETYGEGWEPWQIDQVQNRLWAVREAFLADRGHYRVNVSNLLTEPLETLRGLARWLELDVTEARLIEAAKIVRPADAKNFGVRPPARKALSRDWCRETTVITTAFERPRCLETFVRTCHDYFPSVQIRVADSSREPAVSTDPRVQVFSMPYDAGLSAGRNRLFDEVQTPYVLLADDDVVFTDESDIQRLADHMAAHDYDMVAGTVQRLGEDRPDEFYGYFEELTGGIVRATPQLVPGSDPPRYHLAVNFYLAKTDVLRRVRYRDDLKVGEHVEFFLRCWKAGVKIGCDREVVVWDQHRSSHRGIYGQMRNRAAAMRRPAIAEWLTNEGYRRFVLEFTEGPSVDVEAG